jgi:hypothetical protein
VGYVWGRRDRSMSRFDRNFETLAELISNYIAFVIKPTAQSAHSLWSNIRVANNRQKE